MDDTEDGLQKSTDNKFSLIDKVNLGLNFLNLTLVLVSVFISLYAVKSNEDIALKSGAFDKGVLNLSFGGYFLNSNVDYDVYYGIDFSDSTLHFATLPLVVHNTGEKTIEKASLLIKYPHLANIAIVDSMIEFKYKNTLPDKLERRFVIDNPYDEIAYNINAINPNFSIEIGDLFCLQKETLDADTISVPTNDKDTLKFMAKYSYGYRIIMGLMAKDMLTQQFNINLNYRHETGLNELIRRISQEKLKNKKKSIPNFFVVIPKIDQIVGEKNYRITFMKSSESTTLFCQFDKEWENIGVFNQDGTPQQIIKINGE